MAMALDIYLRQHRYRRSGLSEIIEDCREVSGGIL
jgi:hypothetical protein